ncbi:PH domain-containing protein [bacterium]|nr:PH domain-containing protein [bacterium]
MDEQAEAPLWQGTSSHLQNLWVFVLYSAVFIALVAAFTVVSRRLHAGAEVYIIGCAALLFIYVGFVFHKWLVVRFTVYSLSTERLRITTGVLSRRTEVLELYRVRDFTLLQPLWYRICSMGDIVLTTSDKTTPVVTLRAIHNPAALLDTIRVNVEACRLKKGVKEIDYE